MIFNLKPYPAMQDSGVEWLGDVPAHWEAWRTRYLFTEVDKRSEAGEETHLSMSQRLGLVPSDQVQSSLTSESYAGGKLCEREDLVLNRLKAHLGVFALAKQAGVISPDYSVFRRRCASNMIYFEQALRSPACRGELRIRAKGIVEGFWRLYTDDFYDIRLPVPPLTEQAAIVRYLDHVDRRVRRLVRAKRKLIALLTEQKQAISHRAVTRGLDPDVPLKDSGVDWLGQVPEHWEVVPFKRRVGFQEGPGIMATDFRDTGVPLLRISCLRGRTATLDGCNFLETDMVKNRWHHFAVEPGNYLLSASGSTGAVSLATLEVAGSIPYTGIIRLWPSASGVDMAFVTLFMSSRLFQNQIDLAKAGVGIEHFGPTHLKRMQIVLPPSVEQRRLVVAVETEHKPLDLAITRAQHEVELLNEYRTRLVADVVTGKLDVRNAAAALPEVDPMDADNQSDDTLDAAVEEDLIGLDVTPSEFKL